MSESKPAVILLATRDGERFLPAQLDSILAQSHFDWILIARDDDSSDSTPEILKDHAARDSRISILPGGERLGATGNFNQLMAAAPATGPFFFCDQDDIWPRDRMAKMLAEFKELTRTSPEAPALLHTDLRLIDSEGLELAPSMHRIVAARHADDDPLGLLLAQNFVTGCSAMFNEPLRRLATPIPEEAINHDWWLALVAAATGRIHYLPEALTDHRRHAANTNRISRATRWRDLLSMRAPDNPIRRRLVRRLKQGKALEKRLKGVEPNRPNLARIQAWNGSWAQGGAAAFRAAMKHRIRVQGFRRNAFFLWQLLACLPVADSD